MTQNRRTMKRLERIASMPAIIPPNLEAAFREVASLSRHNRIRTQENKTL